MKVSDIMTQEVISVRPDCSIKEAAEIMLKEHISGLPVIDSSHVLVGIISEGDLLRRAEMGTEKTRRRWLEALIDSVTLAQEYTRSHGRNVTEVMTTDVATVTEDTPLPQAVQLMERRRVKRLPVLRGNRVVGIVTRANLVRALAAVPIAAAKPEDERIRTELEKELSQKSWKPVQSNIIVSNGCVDIWGCILDERHRDAIRVAAENVPGVKSVRDHLVYISIYGVGL